MWKLFVSLSFSLLLSCSSKPEQRGLSSFSVIDISGTCLGIADYGFGRKGLKWPAVRMYLHPSQEEPGAYNAVLLEYNGFAKTGVRYGANKRSKKLSNILGYLNDITNNLQVYRLLPSSNNPLKFEMFPLKVVGEKIEVNTDVTPAVLTLAKKRNKKRPLEGAELTSNGSIPGLVKRIFFPDPDGIKKGNQPGAYDEGGGRFGQNHPDDGKDFQYSLARAIYSLADLKSTWRKKFLPGAYLSAYNKKDDVVLDLSTKGKSLGANFKINPDYSDMNPLERAAIFTSPHSSILRGQFRSTEPVDGMFLFHNESSDRYTQMVVEGRIGVFVDIFDATESLGQDVVELAMVNPNDPKDFLMYYEHPDNGEGEGN